MTVANQERVWKAEAPQRTFLRHEGVDEALYGGARQGGKSDALLIFSIRRRVKHPGSKGLILRRTLADLTKEGALIPRPTSCCKASRRTMCRSTAGDSLMVA